MQQLLEPIPEPICHPHVGMHAVMGEYELDRRADMGDAAYGPAERLHHAQQRDRPFLVETAQGRGHVIGQPVDAQLRERAGAAQSRAIGGALRA